MRYITIIILSMMGIGALNAQVASDSTQRPLRLRIHADSGKIVRDSVMMRVHERTRNQGDTIQIRVQNEVQNRGTTNELNVEHQVVKGEGTKTNIFKRIFTRKKEITVQKEVGSAERARNQVRDTLRLRIRDENGDGVPDSLQIRERERLRLRDGSRQGGSTGVSGSQSPREGTNRGATIPTRSRKGR
ncbi:MAG: hypothetical protein ABIM20_03560 [candidate division WOR-3 bacterium]